MMRRVFAALLLIILGCTSMEADMIVESHTPAVGPDGHLRESIGIETLGGVFTPLLQTGCAIPCSIVQTFSTGEDDQSQIKIFMYRGNGKLVTDAHPLGRFEITGIPSGPRGQPQIRVSVSVTGGNITLRAIDAASGNHLAIRRLDP